MRNTPLSIETGNHHQHLILEMLSMLEVQGHYHYKWCQAHFHPTKGYPLVCIDQDGGNWDVKTPDRPRSRFLSCNRYASRMRTASIYIPNAIADLSNYNLTAWVDGQELRGQWPVRSTCNRVNTPFRLETRPPQWLMPPYHMLYTWSRHLSAYEPSAHMVSSDLQSLLGVILMQ